MGVLKKNKQPLTDWRKINAAAWTPSCLIKDVIRIDLIIKPGAFSPIGGKRAATALTRGGGAAALLTIGCSQECPDDKWSDHTGLLV